MDLKIIEIASHTENQKVIKNYTHQSKNKNPLCGDEMEISLIVKDNIVEDIGYQCKSCIYCQASANLLSKITINKQKSKINELCDDAKQFFEGNNDVIKKKWKLMNKLFKKENIARKECILLPFKTIKKIVSN